MMKQFELKAFAEYMIYVSWSYKFQLIKTVEQYWKYGNIIVYSTKCRKYMMEEIVLT